MKPITAKEIAAHIGFSESFTRNVLDESQTVPAYTIGRLKLYDASILDNVAVLAAARKAASREKMSQHGKRMYASGKLVRKSTRIEERLDRIEAALKQLVEAGETVRGASNSYRNGLPEHFTILR